MCVRHRLSVCVSGLFELPLVCEGTIEADRMHIAI